MKLHRVKAEDNWQENYSMQYGMQNQL